MGVCGDGKPKLYARICFHQRDAYTAFTSDRSQDSNCFADFHVCWRCHWEFNCHNRTFGVQTGEEILRFLHAGLRSGGDRPTGHVPGQSAHNSQLSGQTCAERPTCLRIPLLSVTVFQSDRTEHHLRHGSRAVPGYMLPVHLPAMEGGPTLCAKVPFIHLHQPHFLLLPPHDGNGEERAAALQHLVLHRLEDRRESGRRLHPPVRRRQPAAHPGNHRAQPGGVRRAAADAPEDRAAARRQSQRPGEVEGAVVCCGDADDRGTSDDLRGRSGLLSPAGGESHQQSKFKLCVKKPQNIYDLLTYDLSELRVLVVFS